MVERSHQKQLAWGFLETTRTAEEIIVVRVREELVLMVCAHFSESLGDLYALGPSQLNTLEHISC